MAIEGGAGLGGVGGVRGPGGADWPARSAGGAEGGDAPDFGDTLKEALSDVSHLQDDARSAIQAFVRGDPVEVHEVMAAAEEAGIALEMLIEVRNKLTEAYRTLVNMQA